jgi:hypothetical protein
MSHGEQALGEGRVLVAEGVSGVDICEGGGGSSLRGWWGLRHEEEESCRREDAADESQSRLRLRLRHISWLTGSKTLMCCFCLSVTVLGPVCPVSRQRP